MRVRNGRTGVARVVVALAAVAAMALAVPATAGAAGTKPSIRPTVPLDVTVVPGPVAGELVVSWQPPAYDGEFINHLGTAVPYVITDYDLKGVPARSWASCVDLDLTCTVPGLRSGHTYEVAVRVWNAKGKHSPYTATVPGTPN